MAKMVTGVTQAQEAESQNQGCPGRREAGTDVF